MFDLSFNENCRFTMSEGEIQKISVIEEDIRCQMNCVTLNMAILGKRFREIRDNFPYLRFYADNNRYCYSFSEYVEFRWGLSAAAVSTLIGIYDLFCDKNGAILPQFKGFGYSQLCELLPLYRANKESVENDLPEWVANITPDMTVKKIRKAKKENMPSSLQTSEKKVSVDKGSSVVDQASEVSVVEVADPVPVSSAVGENVLVPKNDKQRRMLFENWKAWDVYFVDKLTGFNWRRIQFSNGDVIVACTAEGTIPIFLLKKKGESCLPCCYVYGAYVTSLVDYLRRNIGGRGRVARKSCGGISR